MSYSTRLNLDDHNDSIQKRLHDVELLVELNDDEAHYEELLHLIDAHHKQGVSYQQIARKFPYVVAYVMVLHGIFHYDEGNYWQGLGMDQNQRVAWVNAFHEVLAESELLRFDWIQNALVNVTPILMHGGIPKTCLADYFSYFLQRFIRIGQQQNSSLQDFRDVWLEQILPHVAKPVQRFIREGGDVALNWMQQSVDMAYQVNMFRRKHPKSTQLNTDLLNNIQLPEWVIQEYWQYLIQKRNVEQGEVISQPGIILDGEYIFIDLPSQTLESQYGDNVYWQFTPLHDDVTTVPLYNDYRGRFIDTRSNSYADITLDTLFGLTITLMQGTRKVHEWSYQRTALVFSVYQKGIIFYTQAQTLPNRAVRIAVPTAQLVVVDGVEMNCVISTGMTDIYDVDVRVVQSVIVADVAYSIQENDKDLRPYLANATKLPFIQPEGVMPVYDAIPDILIPLSRNSTVQEQKQNWRIQVIDITDTNNQKKYIPKSVLQALDENDAHSLVIHLPLLLPQHKPGVYRIELYGKRGRTKDLDFIYVPGLVVVRSNQLQTPSLNRIPVSHQIELAQVPAGWQVDSAIPEGNGHVTVLFPQHPDITQLILTESTTNQKISIDLVFPRLEVQVMHRDGHIISRDEAIVKDKKWYLDAQPSIELVLMPINAPALDDVRVSSSVYLDDGNNSQQLVVKSDSSRRWFRIDTVSAHDTINVAPGGNAQIVVQVTCGAIKYPQISAITIQKLVTLNDPNVMVTSISTGYRLSMNWGAPLSPSNWRVVVWSLSRPWLKVLTYGVQQGITNFKSIIAANDLLPGDMYLVGIMSIVSSRDATPKLPPNSEGLLLLRVPSNTQLPSNTQIQTTDDFIAQLFVNKSSNSIIMKNITDALRDASDNNDKIAIIQHLLLRIHQLLLYAQITQHFDIYWQEFISTIKQHINQINSHKTELFIATMCVMRDVELISPMSIQIFERIILSCFPRLFAVLVKYEIRGALVMTNILSYLPAINERIAALMQQYGIYVEDGIDELFAEVGITDNDHVYGLKRNLMDDFMKEMFNKYKPINYEDALIATGQDVVRKSPDDEVNKAKYELIEEFRDALFPSLIIWILCRAVAQKKDLYNSRRLRDWWYYRQIRVYELLNSYRVNRGGLREYIESGMFRN